MRDLLLVFLVLYLASSGATTPKAEEARFEPPYFESTPQDFDFLKGKWMIYHKRLKERLVGSDEWEEFSSPYYFWPILDGMGNMDELVIADRGGREYRGVSLRLFDPETKQWKIYWVDNFRMVLDRPVIGGFKDGRGEFYDRMDFNGREVIVRFIWKDIQENSVHWEQAYSTDEGKTWETNWLMDFERVGELTPSHGGEE